MGTKIKTLTSALLSLLVVGCASTPTSESTVSPTHKWVPSESVTRAEYNWDHSTCIDASQVEVDGTPRSDPTFVAYQQCMTERGYTLATY